MRVRVLSADFRGQPPPPRFDMTRLTSFFMFFGVSGGEHARRQKLARDFRRFYYPHLATVRVQLMDGADLAPGTYALETTGLESDLNARGWTVAAHDAAGRTATLTGALSEAARAELRGLVGRELELRPKP